MAELTTETKKKNFFRDTNIGQAWLILLMAVVYGVLLALVQIYLSPRIAANMQAETYAAVPVIIFGENVPGNVKVSESAATVGSTVYQVYEVKQDNTVAGFAVKASIMGYADVIELLVGLTADVSEITGVFVLYQKETPGLGSKILDPAWNGQFIGRGTSQPLAVKNGDPATNIDAISGATISSVAVTTLVNNVLKDLKDELVKKAGE